MKMNRKYDFSLKIVVVGDSAVGKTCFLQRYVRDVFDSETQPTLGVEFLTRIMETEKHRIELKLWDTSGQELFRSVTRGYYRGASGAFLVFDVSNRDSFTHVEQWLKDVKDVARRDVVMILLGNKCDLKEKRVVTTQEAEEFAKMYDMQYFETSAKTGEKIREAVSGFGDVIERMIDKGAYEVYPFQVENDVIEGFGEVGVVERQNEETNAELMTIRSDLLKLKQENEIAIQKKDDEINRLGEEINRLREEIRMLREEMEKRSEEERRVIEEMKSEYRRLIPQSMEEVKKESKKITLFYSGDGLNGIIRYLTNECGGNVIDKGVVDPIYSSINFSGVHPRNIVDFDNTNSFASQNEPNSYVGYDFKEKRIKPNSYTIRTWNANPDCEHLKSWVIETSNDNRNWRVIDRVLNNISLNGNRKMKNFPISNSDICRMIRLRQIGTNHYENHYLFVNAFEIFGEIIY